MAELHRVRVWAEALLKLHLDETWSFSFDHAKTRFGQCDHTRRRITLSQYLARTADDDDVHQVLLHEVAHALAGSRAGHGAMWRRVARELGYDGGRTHSHSVAEDQARWLGVCPSGHKIIRFRRPSRPTSCAQCHPTFHQDYIISWQDRRASA